MDTYSATVSFFQDGGIFMYPILIVFALGIAIAIERYIYLTMAKTTNKMVWKQIMPMIKAGRFDQANTIINKSRSAICKILSYGMDRIKIARRRDDLETALEEGLMEVIPRLEKRTHYLATLANIATLLGLLGTIMGLIAAFTAVSNADPADKASLLSSSISVAMNTTAFGLMSAIPMLLVYTILQTKTTEVVDSLEMASVKFMNAVQEVKERADKK
ncbi:MAG TPA: MotA/TolQ/ExbB proton channel family protein [Gammaproteobacteria bacterium]|nr:MotA/TolQ/ExbB proton channel family protein [Gammaproteobacteria bacterium]